MNYLNLVNSGPTVFLLTELVKRLNFIPINQGQRARLMTLAAFISAAAVAFKAIIGHELSVDNMQELIRTFLGLTLTNWAVADGIHRFRKWVESKTSK